MSMYAILLYGSNKTYQFDFIITMSVISFFSFLLFSLMIGRKVLDVYFIFVILTYIFHFGQIFLHILNIAIILPPKFNIFTYNSVYVIASAHFSLQLIMGMQIFGFILDIVKININQKKKRSVINNEKIDLEFFLLILFLTVVPYFYVDISQILIANDLGYVDAYKFGSSYFLSLLSSFFILSLFGFLVTSKSYRLNKIVLFSFATWNLFKMILVGNRSQPMAIVLSLLFLYITVITSKKFKIGIQHIMLGLLIILLLPFIAQVRNISSTTFSTTSFVNYILEENPLSYLMAEFGGTLLTTVMTIQNIPYNVGFSRGLTYIGSFTIFIPFSTTLFGDYFSKYISVGEVMNPYFGGGLGGSWIAELYFNFGQLSIVFVPLITVFIKTISIKISNKSLPTLAINRALLFFILIPLFIYPRGYFYTFITYANIYIYMLFGNVVYKYVRKGGD